MTTAARAVTNPSTSDLDAFRIETRAWLDAHCPPEMRTPALADDDRCWGGRNPRFSSDAQRLWMERMGERGWTVPTWPREYGGGGLDAERAAILAQEMQRLGCRSPLDSFGIWMLGPALLKFGNEAQKREHLPRIARGDIRWCQGYSEPNAGSDLAALGTRAVRDGEHFVVSGQKVWTSYADKADWIFCLVRTDFDARKHDGISFLLFDMASPGVSTRPITLISGKSPFCETFFDEVRVPVANLVGELGGGWTVAKYLLTHERNMIGAMGLAAVRADLGALARERLACDDDGRLAESGLRMAIAQLEADEAAFRLTLSRIGALAQAGKVDGAISSMLKYYGAELNKRRQEIAMDIGGTDALEWESARSDHGDAARTWLRSKANSIEGGTSEVQLNIIAKRILGLPGA